MGAQRLPLILAFLALFGCSSTEESDRVPRELVGTLVRVGAEPFTRLGLKIPDGRIYILQCDQAVQDLLETHQGRTVKVQVRGTEFAPEGVVLLIRSAEILEQSPID
ncbi:MAG: hypothetical protein WBG01_03365 [Bacteroidota bacterium]